MHALQISIFCLDTFEISILEAAMLICFGLSWPVSIMKTLRTTVVSGKSPLFVSLIAVGYICGITHKLLYAMDYLIILYCFNLLLILIDLFLYWRYSNREIILTST